MVSKQKNDEQEISKEIYEIYKRNKHKDSWEFESLYENKDLFIQIIKAFPFPIHICTPDGTIILANDAFLQFAMISEPAKIYKKHNILLNPALERWGIKDFIIKAFQGEVAYAYDVKVPHKEIVERLGDEKASLVEGSMFQNITSFPIRDANNELKYIVTIFVTSRYYQDKQEVMEGKGYLDSHWKERFDMEKLANAVHMSKYHYARLFKQHTGMTPHQYYQDIRIKKLREKLCDDNISVAQAFIECGMDYNGSFAKIFKQKTGMTPSSFKASMKNDGR